MLLSRAHFDPVAKLQAFKLYWFGASKDEQSVLGLFWDEVPKKLKNREGIAFRFLLEKSAAWSVLGRVIFCSYYLIQGFQFFFFFLVPQILL